MEKRTPRRHEPLVPLRAGDDTTRDELPAVLVVAGQRGPSAALAVALQAWARVHVVGGGVLDLPTIVRSVPMFVIFDDAVADANVLAALGRMREQNATTLVLVASRRQPLAASVVDVLFSGPLSATRVLDYLAATTAVSSSSPAAFRE